MNRITEESCTTQVSQPTQLLERECEEKKNAVPSAFKEYDTVLLFELRAPSRLGGKLSHKKYHQ
jgi:hypothetical protein